MATKSTTTSKTQTPEVPTCEICGKTLTNLSSIEKERGHRCDTLLEQGWTAEKIAKHQAKLTVTEVPEGYIKLADLDRLIKSKRDAMPGLTISKMVKAIGRDRALEGPAHPIAKPVYDSRRHRWVNGWLATKDGLEAIRSGDFTKAPKV